MMERLMRAIYTTPIIDNHAHPLLTSSQHARHDLLGMTTEAAGEARKTTRSSLAHLRAVNQLANVLGCTPVWDEVVKAIELEKQKPNDAWARRCVEGIATILIDDGLDDKEAVYPYDWHDRLTPVRCKRIVRLERVAEEVIQEHLTKLTEDPHEPSVDEIASFQNSVVSDFRQRMISAISNPEVVGFKSVICYRTGLDVSTWVDSVDVQDSFTQIMMNYRQTRRKFNRLQDEHLNPFFLGLTAKLITESEMQHKKPMQFHTGLGDNDITLARSSPAHLQAFMKKYPTLPIVLLHASYPFTQEAGYLATVYANVYADIGEVFPFVSKEGQERVLREILELCPSEKILWSTDGHWFPETYLLAVLQVREALQIVLTDYVRNASLNEVQAVKLVVDVLFNTSNTLYNLNLNLQALTIANPKIVALPVQSSPTTWSEKLSTYADFLQANPSVKFLRLQWIDYIAVPRVRVVPAKRALKLFRELNFVGVTKSCLGLLPGDVCAPGVTATGEFNLGRKLRMYHLEPCRQENFLPDYRQHEHE